MSIILGLAPDSKQTISPELQARGLNRLRCTISEIRAWAAPTAIQTAFATYKTILPAYMHACAAQINADVREPFHPVTTKYKDSLPFPYPAVCVTPKSGGVETDQKLLDLGAELNFIRREKVFEFKRPNAQILGEVLKMDLVKTSQASDNMVNLSAFDTFRMTLRVFSEFLLVHRYPAYVDPNHYWSASIDTELTWEMDGETGKKRKRHETDDVGEATVARKKQEGTGKIVTHADWINQDSKSRGHEAIARIKTIPTQARLPWAMKVDDLPPTYGLFIPYHPALFFYDIHQVTTTLSRHFIGSLGSSKEGALKMLEKMKGDWGVLGKTEVGKMISHLAFAIDLALAAQARPIPLFLDGRYVGIFFSGYGYCVQIDGTQYHPQPFETVLKAIEETSTHAKVLAEILIKLGVPGSLDDGMSEVAKTVKDPEFGMMGLRAKCLSAKVTIDERNQILEMAKGLDFRSVRWGVNSNHIAKALDLITDVGSPLPNTLPIHSSMLFENDRLRVVWSGFGFQAPSFLPVGGTHIGLAEKTYTVSFKRGAETVTEVKNFDHIHVRSVTLDTAIEDLVKVRSEGKVALMRSIKRDSKYAERSFERAEFTRIKEGLDKLANVEKKKTAAAAPPPVQLEIEMDDDDL